MPDQNKFQVLRTIDYRVPVTCGMCLAGEFPWKGSPWGTCAIHRYDHKKHDNPDGGRGVSIHAAGTCKSAMKDPARVAVLGAHIEFLEGSGRK